jgi:hypothetical protein
MLKGKHNLLGMSKHVAVLSFRPNHSRLDWRKEVIAIEVPKPERLKSN